MGRDNWVKNSDEVCFLELDVTVKCPNKQPTKLKSEISFSLSIVLNIAFIF